MLQQTIGGAQPPTSAAVQQDTTLLGKSPVQQAATMPVFNPDSLNSTAFQNNPGATAMINALKGGV